jgi:hypothetical protein
MSTFRRAARALRRQLGRQPALFGQIFVHPAARTLRALWVLLEALGNGDTSGINRGCGQALGSISHAKQSAAVFHGERLA